MAIRVLCPMCGRGGKVPDEARGSNITCPACNRSFPFDAGVVRDVAPASPRAEARPRPSGPTAEDVPPPPRRPGPGPEDDGRLVAVPHPGRGPTLLHAALGACAAAMLVMLGIIVLLTRDRDRPDARLAGASIPADPAPSPPAPTPSPVVPSTEPIAGTSTGDSVSLDGGDVPDAPVVEAVAGPPAPRPEPSGEVEAVELPGRPLTTAEIVERCEPSVALIEGVISTGTGFLVAPGILATNAHVIESELIPSLRVRFPSAEAEHAGPFEAELLFEDRARDLAFLRIPSRLPPLVVADGHRYVKGEDVTVIGNPGVGGEVVLENAISKGVMSTRATIDGQEFIQLGIAINPGNSGGPVFDAQGEVIGVATLKTTEQEAMGFCIPVDDLRLAMTKARGPTDPASAAAGHRPRALFRLLTTAGAIHAVGLDRHVIAWNQAQGASLRQLIDEDPGLKELRDGLDELHDGFGPHLDAEAEQLRNDPALSVDIRDGVSRLVASYAQFRSLLSRPPNDLATLLRLVSSAEAAHLDLVRSLAELLDEEVDEELLAALEPLQVQGPADGGVANRIIAVGPGGLTGIPPGFGGFGGRFGSRFGGGIADPFGGSIADPFGRRPGDPFGGRYGIPSIPRPPGMGTYPGGFGPRFP